MSLVSVLRMAENALLTAADRYDAIGFYAEDALLDDREEAESVSRALEKVSAVIKEIEGK